MMYIHLAGDVTGRESLLFSQLELKQRLLNCICIIKFLPVSVVSVVNPSSILGGRLFNLVLVGKGLFFHNLFKIEI